MQKIILVFLAFVVSEPVMAAEWACRARRGQEFFREYCRSQSTFMCRHESTRCRLVVVPGSEGGCLERRPDSGFDSYCRSQSEFMCDNSPQCRWVEGR